jgi:hypothetical protein
VGIVNQIEVVWIGGRNSDQFGYEIWIPYMKHHIRLEVTDDDESKLKENLSVINQSGEDVTEEFVMFDDSAPGEIQPTSHNLYSMMDILLTNYNKVKTQKEEANIVEGQVW